MSKITINIDLTEKEQQQIMAVAHEEFKEFQDNLNSYKTFKLSTPKSLEVVLGILSKKDSGYLKEIKSLHNHSQFSNQLSMFSEPCSLEIEYNL